MRIRSGFISNSSTSSFVVALPASCRKITQAEKYIGKQQILDNIENAGTSDSYHCDINAVVSSGNLVYQLELLKEMLGPLHPDGELCELFHHDQFYYCCGTDWCKMCFVLNKRLDSLFPPARGRWDFTQRPIVTCIECFTEFLAHCIVIRDWSHKLALMMIPDECSFPSGCNNPPAKTEEERAENERHNTQQPINALPNPVLLSILCFLRLNEAVGPCMLVCRRWAALKLSARPTEDATACGVFWKPQAIGYLRDMINERHSRSQDAILTNAEVDAFISSGFSGALQWQYLALCAFARWIRSPCAESERAKKIHDDMMMFGTSARLPLTPITLITQPCKALHFFNNVLGFEKGYLDSYAIGGFLLLVMDRAGVSPNGTLWQLLKWAKQKEEENREKTERLRREDREKTERKQRANREEEEEEEEEEGRGGYVGFGSMGSESLDDSIRDIVFDKDEDELREQRKVCEEKRNKRRASVVEQWGLREMWAEVEQRDREEKEEKRKREEEERKREEKEEERDDEDGKEEEANE